jgi:hypothetical protein
MKIVITGQPEIGKTTLSHILGREFGTAVHLAPDAMDILNNGLFPDANTVTAQKCRQRALYHVQKEIENLLEEKRDGRLIICDHGTLDFLARWPDTASRFFDEVDSSLEKEFSRYEWVLQILPKQARFQNQLYGAPPLNPQNFWSLHPRHIVIPAELNFSSTVGLTSDLIREFLKGDYEKNCLRYRPESSS